MSREQWLSQKVSALADEDERFRILNEIHDYFRSLPYNEAAQSAKLLQMPLLFDCLNDSNTDQIDLACDVLSICLETMSLGESTNRYNAPLERALKHPHNKVKQLALKDIERNTANEELLMSFCRYTNLLMLVLELVGEEDLGISQKASDILVEMGSSENAMRVLFSGEMKNTIGETMSKSEVIRLRYFEIVDITTIDSNQEAGITRYDIQGETRRFILQGIFINMAKKSEASHSILESSGFLNEILHDLENEDILLRLNIVELLSRFVVSEQGYRYLDNNGVMLKFCEQLKESDDLLFIQLCEPGILKFFGQLAHWRPHDLVTKYMFILNRIYANIQTDNYTIVNVSVDTLGHVAATNEGKIVLNSLGDTISKILSSMVEKLNKFPNEVKVRVLNCVQNFLHVRTNDTRILQITRRWYTALTENPMDFIMRYAKNPFSELRSAGLGILHALALQNWGQEVIKNTPGLLEFLMDRSVESIKECKELKYEIVKDLVSSDVFSRETNLKLQVFIDEGPFYIQGVTEVAFE